MVDPQTSGFNPVALHLVKCFPNKEVIIGYGVTANIAAFH